ncbi:MAG: carbohydrate ABC transporter permease [Sphaerochaetaceae bacterium]|jgi:multiple sugar transport system permease protein
MKKHNSFSIEGQKARWGWFFVAPAILFFCLFSLYPMLNALWNTFFNVKLLSLKKPEFVGLKNYAYVLSSPDFWSSVKATVIFTLSSFIPLTVFSLVFGLIITTRKKGHQLLQMLIYSPAVLSSVVAALIWLLLFDPRGIANSLVNFLMRTPGIDHKWLTEPAKLYMATAMIYFWKYIGYFTIIVATGVAKIPTSVLEAATIDGASVRQTIGRIIMPLLRPTTMMVSIVAMLNCMKSFSTQYLFTQRGAPNAPLNVLTLNIYKTAMRDRYISRACVMSFILFFFMMILTIVRMKTSESKE